MVNNYPEYAAGVSYQKAEENVKHFYNAQVKVDPSDDSMSAVLAKDGVVVSELPGSGGSSDFSTAEVTFDGEVSMPLVYISEDEGYEGIVYKTQTWSGTVNVPLYKGSCVNISSISAYNNLTVTGDAQIINGGSMLIITGNCTIKLS